MKLIPTGQLRTAALSTALILTVAAVAAGSPADVGQNEWVAGEEKADDEKKVLIWYDEGGNETVIEPNEDFVFISSATDPNENHIFRPLVDFFGGGFLGVQLLDLTPELLAFLEVPDQNGILVSKVVEESPAESAGVEVGDVITSIGGHSVNSSLELSRRVREHEVGDLVEVEAWRKGRLQKLTVEIGERKGDAHFGSRDLHFTHEFDLQERKEAEERLKAFVFEHDGDTGFVHFNQQADESEKLVQRLHELEEKLERLEKHLKELDRK